MENIEQAYEILLTAALIILGVGIFLAIIRSVKGPRIADRIVSVNMVGTITIMAIAILSVLLKQEYLADVCLIYVLLSFLAVVVLTKAFINVYMEKKRKEKKTEEIDKL